MAHHLWIIKFYSYFWLFHCTVYSPDYLNDNYHYKIYENDNLFAIEIADKRINKDNNEYIVVECGINPSHWIAIHSCLNLIQNPSAIELTGKESVIRY